MEIIPLDEGIYHVNRLKQYQLVSLDDLPPDQYTLRMSVRPFLIKTGTDIILLDTGLAAKTSNNYLIKTQLAEHGIKPEQVTIVLLSHLHNDHVGGVGYLHDDVFQTHFTNAAIYLQQSELNFALTQHDNPSYNIDLLLQLGKCPNVTLLTTENGSISPGITYQVVGGHTPYMQVFWLQNEKQTIFYGADDLPNKNYLNHHIAYKTDFEGRKAMELRRRWEQQAKAEHWKVLFYHDTEVPFLQF